MTADASLQQRFGLTVTPQNVLGVRAVVLQEAQDLRAMLRAERERVILPALGVDPVSKDMSLAFNEVTEQLLARTDQHVRSLFELGDELAATARTYGHAEADITASFGPDSPQTAASRIAPVFLQGAGMGATSARLPSQSLGELMTGGRS